MLELVLETSILRGYASLPSSRASTPDVRIQRNTLGSRCNNRRLIQACGSGSRRLGTATSTPQPERCETHLPSLPSLQFPAGSEESVGNRAWRNHSVPHDAGALESWRIGSVQLPGDRALPERSIVVGAKLIVQ